MCVVGGVRVVVVMVMGGVVERKGEVCVHVVLCVCVWRCHDKLVCAC